MATPIDRTLKGIVPEGLKQRLKRYLPGRYPAYCPVCDTRHAEFWPFGGSLRPNALCPQCKGLERHRMLWLFLKRHTDIGRGDPVRLLHFAPEPDFGARLAHLPGIQYISTDLGAERTPTVMTDITAMGLGDESFDAAICSHVLEHVPEDRRAMRECWRVIRPGGWLAVQVPMHAGPTDEDPSIQDPKERERRFGQNDHVRMYGPDIVERLKQSGFGVTVYPPDKVVRPTDGDVGIPPTEGPILFCSR